MIRASCEGALDFSTTDVLDPRWWQKFWLVIDYVGAQVTGKLASSTFDLNCALLDYDTDQTVFDLHWKQAIGARNTLIKAIAPWIEVEPTDMKSVIAKMKKQYTKAFGDPDSPEYRAEVDKLLAYWASCRRKRRG